MFSKDCNDLVDSNVIFNVSMPLQHNTSQGIPVRGSARCSSSANISAVPNCASLYSQSALQPDACEMAALSRFVRTRVAELKGVTVADSLNGSGANFANATLRQQLQYGDAGSCRHDASPDHCIMISIASFGFTEAQLDTKVVSVADFNFVEEAHWLHVGATSAWDHHTVILDERPFVPVHTHPWDRSAVDYGIAAASPPGSGAFHGSFNLSQIGLLSSFPHDVAALHFRSAFSRIQGEDFDRSRGLWTSTALAVGAPQPYVDNAAQNRIIGYAAPFCPCVEGCPPCAERQPGPPDAIEAGSWVRFDNIGFGGSSAPRRLSVRARVKASFIQVAGGAKLYGATVRFQLGDPRVGIPNVTLATVRIPAPNEGNGTRAEEDGGYAVINGSTGDCLLSARTIRGNVFAVFTMTPGSYRVGGFLDWFEFVVAG